MTGGRCPRRKKMMGRGPDGGCGTEERPCRLISRVPATQPEISPTTKKKPTSFEVDFFSQARKALSERSPFDIPEDGSGSTLSGGSSIVSTLPSGLASLLKHSDSRKRHKKSHSSADKKSSRASERAKGGNIWVETEEYFRNLALPDIDSLFEISSSIRSLAASKCFLIPYVGNEKHDSGLDPESLDKNVIMNCGNGNAHANEVVDNNVTVNCGNGNAHVNEVLAIDEVKQEDEQFMQIDSVRAQSHSAECLPQEEGKVCSVSDFCSGLEWLLGCRSRIMLTSERPSKKRKLLGMNAGLEKVLIGSSGEGNSSLCDFCCKGETGNESNRLIVCSSCKVAIHLNCYGVNGDVDESWLCSWCKHKSGDEDSVKQPCVLCPKQGGALKPVGVESSGSVVEFVHLFCSLWMPEVYVEDLKKMEPVMNVREIKETRRKLVCNVCKVKCGACVRCSHGMCRAAFHPICAREARHRMEAWGKYGSENVELRAFCSKHSEFPDDRGNPQLGDSFIAMRSDSFTANCIPSKLLTDKQHKLKIGQNGDKVAVHVEAPDSISDKSGDSESQEIELSDSRLNDVLVSECADGNQINNMDMPDRSDNEDANLSDSLNLALILKKLIDRGKVNTKDVALEIGISPNSLLSTLAEDNLVPDLQCKIVKWLRNHVYMGTFHKNLNVKQKSAILSKAEMAAADCSDGVTALESDITDPVAVKSVPPRRRTKGNIRIFGDNKIICSSKQFSSDSGTLMDEVKVHQLANEEPENSSEVSIPVEKKTINLDEFQDSSATHCSKSGDNMSGCPPEKVESENVAVPQQDDSSKADHPVLPDLIKMEEFSHSYVHTYIHKKLLKMQNEQLLKGNVCELEGLRVGETSSLEASSNASVCCDHQNIHSMCNDLYKSDEVNPEQLVKAENMEVCKLSPADEVEGEIIYFQHRLLGNAVARKHFTDNLICKVARSLPQEIDTAKAQRWDAVLVNQYLIELREAKKQGRKERKHKEAQAVLAAATAAAAASSRISSFRKDTFDDSNHHEKFNISNGRAGISSLLMPRPKETLSRVAVPRNSSEKNSDFVQSVSDFSKEHPRSCDICRRSETILNPILVCSSCKVAVHLDCYRSVKESTGPWYCELCEELLSSKCSATVSLNFWEKPYFVAECGLCGGTTGAFRKSTDGQWVHAFCAEWVFEPTFQRGQVNPVEGMETVAKGVDICCVCRHKHGVCIKCSYGHCQTTFHPSCARSTGFYMNVKSLNGKLHKAYCERHGLEQRAKAETQKHGFEELKSMKQIRVELERLRLLCERIVKREKIKRDLVLCSHCILACKRDHVARSVLVHSPFVPLDVSSESATTSLKGNTDGYKSCSDAIQRSDDVTVDSTVSIKHQIKVAMDADQKTDDSSTSQHLFTRRPMERIPFAGKQIPLRASLASRNPLDDGEWSSKSRKRFETFEKELVMTSDQASMKNQQLPKGYFYIPVDCLPKEKQMNQDARSGELLEHHR
ncbi:uncharacterized protein LOC110665553 isoform X2 [Hevea brasiliensis]|uniref:uncharacterized protein LOC110665553 isoform X2 n=1 Tax=Hevea brasiliensis TaxID=3981 RepID=UPI0025E4E4D4|nr:uncharacterized protein LOC110665553 isoform X2 [Hevea brasiliensis]